MATMDARSDSLAAADAALERGEWEKARAAFERAIAAAAGPEALEGLATAAWFLDEAPLVFDARERAYAGYREAGRAIDAARVAIALAWDYRIFRGEPAVGDGWLARARRLLEGRGPTREGCWLLIREASFALPGDATRARRRCAEARELARELEDVDLEMTALALDGLSSPGALEDLARQAGLTPTRAAEFSTRWDYPDRETALRGHLSSGPAVRAIKAVGEDRVAAAVSDAIAPFRTASGGYALENSWRYLLTTA